MTSSASSTTTSRCSIGRSSVGGSSRSPRICARARQNAQNRPVVGWPHRSQADEHGIVGHREQRPAPLQVPQEELRLGPGRRRLDGVHGVLVPELGVAGHQRALLHHVVDAPEERVRGGLQLREPEQRLDLLDHALACRAGPGSGGRCTRSANGACCPASVAASSSRLWPVAIDVEPAVQRRAVEHVALRQPADRARRPRSLPPGGRDVEAVVTLQVDDDELRAAFVRERLGHAARPVGVPADAQTQVQPRRVVAEVEQDVPQRERVLAAGDGDQDPVLRREHVVSLIARFTCSWNVEEAILAVRRVVPPHLDHRGSAASVALHAAPPEMTGRTSISSASSRRVSRVTSPRADHQHGVGVHAELIEDRPYRPAPHDLDLPVGVTQPHLHRSRLAHDLAPAARLGRPREPGTR